jgi:hypothetical protein
METNNENYYLQLCECERVAYQNWLDASASGTEKMRQIGCGKSSINPTLEELNASETAYELYLQAKKKREEFVSSAKTGEIH